MSSDFLKVMLADLCTDVSYGYTASSISEPVGPKFLRITDIQGGAVDWASVPYCEASESAKRKNKLERGDIVIARTGNSTGENYIFESNEDTIFASYLIRFRVNPALANPYFVWLQLRTQAWWDYVSGSKSGSAQAGANAKVLGCYELNLPDRKVQNKIELIFRKLNEKNQVNQQISQTLEQMAQAIFKSWFVDFEPVKAKVAALEAGGSEDDALLAAMQAIAGSALFATDAADTDAPTQLARLQTEHPEQYATLRATAELFPSAMQESELGEIPEGWRASKLSDEFDVTMGQSPPGHTYNEAGDGVPFFQGRRDFGVRYPSNRVYCTEPKRMAKAEDTLLSVRAPVGDTNLARTDCCIGRGIAALRHKSGCSSFTYYSVIQLGQALSSYDSEGTVFGSINQKNLNSLLVIAPPKEILSVFSQIVGATDSRIKSLSEEVSTLAELRETLLPKLLSGELSVAEAE